MSSHASLEKVGTSEEGHPSFRSEVELQGGNPTLERSGEAYGVPFDYQASGAKKSMVSLVERDLRAACTGGCACTSFDETCFKGLEIICAESCVCQSIYHGVTKWYSVESSEFKFPEL